MKVMVMRYTLLLLALLGASCSSTLPSVKPYHLDVQQGNVVTAKMMMQLKPGMTKSQVRYVLGTPLLQDAFHQNRWDYIYQMAKGGKVIERRRIILDFESDSLKAVRGDVIPSGAPGAEEAPIASVTDLKTVKSDKTLLAEDPKTTWYDRFKFWSDDKEKSDKAADKAEVNKAEVKAEPKAAANQTPEKSWYDSLKFWESDKKPAPETVKPAQVVSAKEMPVQKAPEPAVAEAPQAPAQEALQSVEPSASEEVVDTKAAVKEVVDQVVDQPAQLAEETKPEQSAAAYQEAVAKALNAWANAWRNKNVSAYLKAYSDKFQPEGMGKKAWVAQRTQRVGSKSGAITLVLDKVSIQADAKKATTSFVQRYASGNFSDVVNKVMSFENTNGQWLIVKESVTTEPLQPTGVEPVKAEAAGEMYVKPRDVTPDEKSEAMPEKLLQESAKQAQQVKPAIKLEPKPVEAKPAEMKPVEIKQPAAKAVPEKAPEIKPTARKDAPLPSEDAPDFFERMLEKIGF
jgi:outer membrane protein assembly factor BamE